MADLHDLICWQTSTKSISCIRELVFSVAMQDLRWLRLEILAGSVFILLAICNLSLDYHFDLFTLPDLSNISFLKCFELTKEPRGLTNRHYAPRLEMMGDKGEGCHLKSHNLFYHHGNLLGRQAGSMASVSRHWAKLLKCYFIIRATKNLLLVMLIKSGQCKFHLSCQCLRFMEATWPPQVVCKCCTMFLHIGHLSLMRFWCLSQKRWQYCDAGQSSLTMRTIALCGVTALSPW